MGSRVIIPINLMLDNELEDKAKILYTILLDESYGVYNCTISQNKIAEKLNVTDRTIRNALNSLVKKGLILTLSRFKQVNKYIIMPYEWVGKYTKVEDEEEFNKILKEVQDYFNNELNPQVKKRTSRIKTTEDIIKDIDNKIENNKELSITDYCKYFYKKAYEKYGIITKYSGVKYNSIMKRIMEGRTPQEVLQIIDTYITIYENRFKKEGFENPTIEGLGTTWIFNIVVDIARRHINTTVNNGDIEEDVDYTF
ncbi:MAG: helix-turn-helix domain-containing protein [Cetobacterium sp.]